MNVTGRDGMFTMNFDHERQVNAGTLMRNGLNATTVKTGTLVLDGFGIRGIS